MKEGICFPPKETGTPRQHIFNIKMRVCVAFHLLYTALKEFCHQYVNNNRYYVLFHCFRMRKSNFQGMAMTDTAPFAFIHRLNITMKSKSEVYQNI